MLLACALRAADVTVSEADGDETTGPLKSVKADGSLEVGAKTVKIEDIAEVRVKGVSVTPSAKARVLLRDGDSIYADVLQGTDKTLKVKQDLLGELVIKNNSLKGLVFPVKDAPADSVIAGFFAGADLQEDQMLTPKGESVNGFMENFDDKKLTFDAGGQKREVPYEQLAAFRFAALEKFTPAEGVRTVLRLSDGSRVSGKLSALEDGALKLASADGTEFKVPLAALHSIEIKGGKLTYLTDLEPQAEERPYIGGAPFVRRWRKNLSASGERLRIGRKDFTRGLGVHSYCKLAYALDGAYARFLCEVGMDEGAASGAECAYRVVADGKELHAGTAKAGEAPKKLKLELQGAKTLELICDFGPDHDDAGDHFDWADARLVK
ncbi:MAG: NPCBM/NEW2 domain-containing protein [Planctomycetota bacterium]|nr:NPCBM/NEW2 domain-containing protein [Planctomycetota bacterium]